MLMNRTYAEVCAELQSAQDARDQDRVDEAGRIMVRWLRGFADQIEIGRVSVTDFQIDLTDRNASLAVAVRRK